MSLLDIFRQPLAKRSKLPVPASVVLPRGWGMALLSDDGTVQGAFPASVQLATDFAGVRLHSSVEANQAGVVAPVVVAIFDGVPVSWAPVNHRVALNRRDTLSLDLTLSFGDIGWPDGRDIERLFGGSERLELGPGGDD